MVGTYESLFCHSMNAGSMVGIPWGSGNTQHLAYAKEFIWTYCTQRQWGCKNFGWKCLRAQALALVPTGADPGFGQGGAPASEAKSCRRSEAELHERSKHSAAGVQGPLKGPGSFWVFDAQICIFTHSRDSFSLIFDIFFDTKSW